MSSLAISKAGVFPDIAAIPAVWRADELARNTGATRATGHAALDAALPGGGWPVGSLVELLQPQAGQGEWRLLLPALAVSSGGPVVLVNPPHRPFVPGLAAQGLDAARLLVLQGPTLATDAAARVWACEQALRCGGVAAVLAWLPQVRPEQLRRLQMAASEYAKLLFVMRPAQVQTESSPAVLRLLVALQDGSDDLRLDILKRRGPPCMHPLQMPARIGRLAALLARSRAGRKAGPVRPLADVVEPPARPLLESPDVLDRAASLA